MISITDQNNKVIYQDHITSLPIRDEGMINKSKELFYDSEPCIIHKTFIIKQFFFKLDNYLNDLAEHSIQEVSYDMLPDWITKMVKMDTHTKMLLMDDNKS